jgi:type II secretory ATPase GspE/PulE/Tfp pilus assembly ATPase PilB-like protein
MGPAIASRIKIMASLDISERRIPQDGGITVQVSKRKVDLRVSTIPGKFGEKVVMRVIDKKDDVQTLDALNFPPALLERWRQLIAQPNGILLVTGPTGSGKSTTLYATLGEINEDSINISTVEDPVEYNLAGVNQFQTNNKAGFTFASALRSLLRQDPDVVMVGEIRDAETGKTAVQAALTGHLVFSTLHTNDAPSAVTRLFNIGVEPYLVAASVQGVLAQRLVRRLCPHCKEPGRVDDALASAWNRVRPDLPLPETVMQPVGCAKCNTHGFKGRVGLYELFIPDAAALDAVSRGATLQEVRKLAGRDSYTTLLDDGIAKVEQGLTTLPELLAVASA